MSQGTEAEVLPHLAVAWRAAPKKIREFILTVSLSRASNTAIKNNKHVPEVCQLSLSNIQPI